MLGGGWGRAILGGGGGKGWGGGGGGEREELCRGCVEVEVEKKGRGLKKKKGEKETVFLSYLGARAAPEST